MAQAWPPGWYSDTKGRMRWWDGSRWGAQAPQPRAAHPGRTALVFMLASTLVAGGTAVGVALVVRGGDGPDGLTAAGTSALTALSGDVAAYTTTPRSGEDAQRACEDLAADLEAATLGANAADTEELASASIATSIVDDATAQAAMATDAALDGSIVEVGAASTAATDDQAAGPAFARQATEPSTDCAGAQFKIYYVNGVLSTSADAAAQANWLASELFGPVYMAYNSQLENARDYRFEMCRRALVRGWPYTSQPPATPDGYDPMRGDPDGYYEALFDDPVVWQEWLRSPEPTLEAILTPETADVSAPCRGLDASFDAPGFTVRQAWDAVQGVVRASAEAALRVDPSTEAIVPMLIAAIQQDVVVGRSIVIVGHSSGSLLVRHVVAQLQTWFDMKKAEPEGWDETDQLPVARFYIAPAFTPASDSFENYILREGDWVQPHSGAAPTYLDDPRAPHPTLAPLVTHRLRQYLGVAGYIYDVFAPLRRYVQDNSPGPLAQGGIIHATLTWSAPNDVDLYVTEPDNTRVYYSSQHGTSGDLDLDNTQGTGPENYRVLDCTKLQEGSYLVGVNYFASSTPESPAPVTATITVTAGPHIETRTVMLQAPDRGATVVPVFTVLYETDGMSDERFTISSA